MEEEGDGSVDEMGQKQTIKLVFPPSETYQSLAPPLPPAASNKGSIRALRDKLSTLTSSRKLLARTGAPNKRRLEPVVVPPPSAPEWIRPRAVSPTSQLSPPLQPHLFFHPTPSATSIHGVLGRTESESGSDYGSDDDVKNSSHMRLPTIPSTAEKLSESYTAVPRKSPRTKGVKRVQTLGGMSKDISPVKVKRSSTAAAATTPSAGLRRSIAIPDLSSPERIRVSKRKSTATSPRKSRVQRKEERARDKVESILQASWSDRALQSPPLQESRSIQGQLDAAAGQGWVAGVGMNSPGVEEAAGAGIEQRLGMLKRLEG
ncbi:hypothetical protein BCR39DRAFT_562320 [Naematelia encephala]|uniref:Uncharacterized protein n=1 Tax=Naematelia encephala TaxID=71784 RepID=A0A1Y2AIN4_9TREE|nr:hypothetical protein BCR39DRAFT_562320 [Naematelia encephala]